MKKLVVLILIAISLFGISIFSGNDSRTAGDINVGIFNVKTGQSATSQVSTVNLIFGKEDILSDVPAFILDSRTLVPIRFITDTLGADISWNQQLRQATIIKDGKEIVLTIDSDKATVNGKIVNLPSGVPAKLVEYEGISRTMVPFRFVSEQLGMEIEWISDTYTAAIDYPKSSITSIQYKQINGIPSVVLKGSGKFNHTSMYIPALKLGATNKLIIDIPNADLGSKNVFSQNINENGITSMRASLFETSPRETVRVTVELDAQSSYKTAYNEQTNELYINFVNTITDIAVDSNAQAVVIETDEVPVFNVEDLGDRVVVDILDAAVQNMDFQDLVVDNEVVEKIRYSQFDSGYEGAYDKVTRVVFDLKSGKTLADNMFVDTVNNNVVVYMTTDPMNQLNYEYASLSESTLTLELDSATKSKISNDDVNRILTIYVDKSRIDLLDELRMDMNDGIVKYIDIDGKTKNSQYIVKVKYNSDIKYNILEGENSSNRIKISFAGENIPVINTTYSNKLVVIDPGHGGYDGGANRQDLGKTKYFYEKNLNLDTSLKLKDLLEEAGFKVYMTRTTDVYVGLYERAEVANAMKADLLISVHHNSMGYNRAPYGVLTLYDGSGRIWGKTELAKIIQKNMVNTLDAKDRGLMNKPAYIVPGKTNIPSALAELGFMSNDYELGLLQQEWYRQKCALSLFNGVKEFVDKY